MPEKPTKILIRIDFKSVLLFQASIFPVIQIVGSHFLLCFDSVSLKKAISKVIQDSHPAR